MKTNLENISNLEKKLKIEVPTQTVNEEFSKAFKYLQREANIKGFRKGKAPLATIKTMYSDKVKGDVVQNIVQSTYWNALKEHKLIPVSMPSIDFEEIKEDTPFTFTANFEIRPEIKIQKKTGFKVEKEKLSVDEARIDS
ncbi:trigger factor family protein, partial [bacterium]|nr:trigger factor family protein [bacterium]